MNTLVEAKGVCEGSRLPADTGVGVGVGAGVATGVGVGVGGGDAPAGSGLILVPAVGVQDAVGVVSPHHRLLLFSCQIVPLT